MFKRIDHVELITSDLERAVRFYCEILGFKVKERKKVDHPPMEEIVFLQLNDTLLELISGKAPAPAPAERWRVGYRMMAMEVEDMDRAVEYLKGKGVEISQEPVVLGTSKRGEMKDPDGNILELRQW
jgi:glyoxylase I family protein